MDRPLYFVEDRNLTEVYGVMFPHRPHPNCQLERKPLPTLRDYFTDHVARNDPRDRDDLVHPFVD